MANSMGVFQVYHKRCFFYNIKYFIEWRIFQTRPMSRFKRASFATFTSAFWGWQGICVHPVIAKGMFCSCVGDGRKRPPPKHDIFFTSPLLQNVAECLFWCSKASYALQKMGIEKQWTRGAHLLLICFSEYHKIDKKRGQENSSLLTKYYNRLFLSNYELQNARNWPDKPTKKQAFPCYNAHFSKFAKKNLSS